MNASSPRHVLGVIGGSGLYEMSGLEGVESVKIDTPYGAPSDDLVRGRMGDTELLFLPRHGRGHRVPPHQINFRANVCALKLAGATHLVSVSAVGSMREEIEPGHLVIVDQFIDLTRRRVSTFFEDGIAGHVPFGDPVCDKLASCLADAVDREGGKSHRGGTYVCIDGPQFSSRAESLVYRSWGVSVIGMTAMPEAKLAREAELPFALLALATDYDCWHAGEEDVSVDAVVAVVKKNADLAKRVVARVSQSLFDPKESRASGVLAHAVMTDSKTVPEATWKRTEWLLGDILKR